MKRIIFIALIALGLTSCSKVTEGEEEFFADDDVTSTSGSNSDADFNNLVKQNVTCTASFSDFFTTVKVTSKLGSTVTFFMAHGTADDDNCSQITSNRSWLPKTPVTTTSGSSTIVTMKEPFYYYYYYLKNSWGNNRGALCEDAMSQYIYLRDKGTSGSITIQEQVKRNELYDYLDNFLDDAIDDDYTVYVFAQSGAKSVRIGKFRVR